jgi:hypothetical protein
MALGPTIKITPSVTKVTRETTSHHQKNQAFSLTLQTYGSSIESY